MLEHLRALVNSLLPWYDEQRAQAETAKTHASIQRSQHHRHRAEQIVQLALAHTDRRRASRVRDDYRRASERVGR